MTNPADVISTLTILKTPSQLQHAPPAITDLFHLFKMYMLSHQIWVVEPDPAELLQVEPPGVTHLLPLM